MRALPVVMMALALAACDPVVPESGVGFGDYSQYLRDRERALAAGTRPPVPATPVIAAPTVSSSPSGFSPDRAAAAIDAAEGRTAAPAAQPAVPLSAVPLDATDPNRPRGNAPAGIQVESGEVQGGNSATISDENDFNAVSARETIESDAERIARNRAQYQVVQPTDLPQRQGGSGPNIVSFALSTTHAPGTPVYRRSGFGGNGSNCGRYGSTDLAQEAFLSEGGPERDRRGLDPDGDGFACGWDPRPFRAAKQ
ncbi:MAG: hypothetical protein ACT4OK_13540 [Gemmobacter sp.]